jgi:fatty acid-binding protein DegV
MVRVLPDTSCDLPHELLEEPGITVVPLVVRIGKE